MKKETADIHIAQEAARAGMPPHAMLRLLRDRFAPTTPLPRPILAVERCLLLAFGIPLRIVRDIEMWEGFSQAGTFPTSTHTDQDIDNLLAPWIAHYLAREARLPIHDLYGFTDTPMDTARAWVESAVATSLRASYSTYRGGDYYCSARDSQEEVIVQRNFDSVTHEW
ncbi:MAG: hypothetical protein ACLFVO_15675 [Chloroflexaceae bacterium]